MNKSSVHKIVSHINQNQDSIPYRGKIIKLKVTYDETQNELILHIFNCYYFKDYLKKAGYVYSPEDTSWSGYIHDLLSIEETILLRMIDSMDINSKRTLSELIRVIYIEV